MTWMSPELVIKTWGEVTPDWSHTAVMWHTCTQTPLGHKSGDTRVSRVNIIFRNVFRNYRNYVFSQTLTCHLVHVKSSVISFQRLEINNSAKVHHEDYKWGQITELEREHTPGRGETCTDAALELGPVKGLATKYRELKEVSSVGRYFSIRTRHRICMTKFLLVIC